MHDGKGRASCSVSRGRQKLRTTDSGVHHGYRVDVERSLPRKDVATIRRAPDNVGRTTWQISSHVTCPQIVMSLL